jgi:hypothetical protein
MFTNTKMAAKYGVSPSAVGSSPAIEVITSVPSRNAGARRREVAADRPDAAKTIVITVYQPGTQFERTQPRRPQPGTRFKRTQPRRPGSRTGSPVVRTT